MGVILVKSKIYREKVLDHMSKYKKDFLGITQRGIYQNSPKDYGHILPKPMVLNEVPIFNLLPTIDVKNEVLNKQQIKYHQYAHHLNSSQLMCINFFLPIIKDKILLDILSSITTINLHDDMQTEVAEFEKTFKGKDDTNFDFYIKLSTGENIYFEIKYTELDFGGNCFEKGKLREQYEKKYNTFYKNELKGSLMNSISGEEFFKNYQINRNLSYIKNQNDYVVFIVPFDSEDLHKKLIDVVNKNTNIKSNIMIIDWKELCEVALEKSKDTMLHQHYRLFRDKYIV